MGSSTPDARRIPIWALVILLALGWWLGQGRGVLSSNDGSHVALARALGVRATTQIDPDAWMTLGVDVARREGHYYSDRPPGVAVGAIPAVRVGALLDPGWLERAQNSGELLFDPASTLFASTKAKRSPGSPALAAFQGTAFAISIHAALVAASGLWALALIALHLGADDVRTSLVLVVVAASTAYGGYAAFLFNHVSACALTLWALVFALAATDNERASPRVSRRSCAALAGFAGAWAIACDYSLVIALPPLLALTLVPRHWPAAIAGTLIPGALVALYHDAAFGSPFAIGYDFNLRFEFARDRASTFGANPLVGAWQLFGIGEHSGWLSRSPVLYLGVVGYLQARDQVLLRPLRRWCLALCPWVLLICSHQTPLGGAGADYRYLIVLVPFAALGLLGFSRGRRTDLGLALAALVSAAMWWVPFWQRFSLEPIAHPATLALVWTFGVGGWLLSRRRSP